jgi:hypothetical protein
MLTPSAVYGYGEAQPLPARTIIMNLFFAPPNFFYGLQKNRSLEVADFSVG